MNPKPKKFPWVIYLIVLLLILLVAAAPVISVLGAGVVANWAGCKLDEGSAHPCVIGGHDYGELFYTLFVLGWFMFLTFPAGVIAVLVWLIAFLTHLAMWRKRRARDTSGPPGLPPV